MPARSNSGPGNWESRLVFLQQVPNRRPDKHPAREPYRLSFGRLREDLTAGIPHQTQAVFLPTEPPPLPRIGPSPKSATAVLRQAAPAGSRVLHALPPAPRSGRTG